MDHLADNLDNIANAKGRRTPLFGSLSYFHFRAPPVEGGTIITVMGGALHGGESMPAVNPAGRELIPPVDLFQLAAFGLKLELEPPLATFRDYITSTQKSVEDQIRADLPHLAATHNVTEQQLMAHPGRGFAIALDIKFSHGRSENESEGGTKGSGLHMKRRDT